MIYNNTELRKKVIFITNIQHFNRVYEFLIKAGFWLDFNVK